MKLKKLRKAIKILAIYCNSQKCITCPIKEILKCDIYQDRPIGMIPKNWEYNNIKKEGDN